MRRDIHRRELRPAVENVSTEARRDLRVGEQLHEAENATWQWWKEVHRLTTAC